MTIPIVGQPEVVDYSLTVLLKCSCGTSILLVGRAGFVFKCGTCQRNMQFTRFATTPTGQLALGLGVLADGATPTVGP